MAQQQITEWHRQLAAGIAAAHPLTSTTPIQARGNHLAAQNDEAEPEAIDRGPLTQPAELAEADWIAADLARDNGKGERLARANDAHALDLQLQFQGYIGGLPA
jgi:hypothetical protein